MNKCIGGLLFVFVFLITSSTVQAQVVQSPGTAPGQQPATTSTVVVQGTPQVPQPPTQQPVFVQQQPGQPQVIYVQQAPRTITETVERPLWGLIISGIVTLSVSYVSHAIVNSIVSSVSSDDRIENAYGFGFLPGLGPFIQAGIGGNESGVWTAWLISMGLVQAYGIIAIAVGATSTREVTVTRQAGNQNENGFASNWHLLPYGDSQGGGMHFGMSF